MNDKVKPNIRYALELMLEWANMVSGEYLASNPEVRAQYRHDIQKAREAINYLVAQEKSK